MAYVYILQSKKNNRYYIGSTKDINVRFKQHNSGCVKSTKNNRPYKLAYYQKYDSIKEAKLIEMKIKKWKRKDYIDKVIGDGIIYAKGR
jgi:putative endonuclease